MSVAYSRGHFSVEPITDMFTSVGKMTTFDTSHASANAENYAQQQSQDDFSHLENNPWVQSLHQRVFEKISQGNSGAALDLIINTINDTAINDPEIASELFAYFKYELEDKGYNQLSNILEHVFGTTLDIEDLTPSSDTALAAFHSDGPEANSAAGSLDEQAVKANFIKENRTRIEDELEKQRRLNHPAPSFLGLG